MLLKDLYLLNKGVLKTSHTDMIIIVTLEGDEKRVPSLKVSVCIIIG